MHVRIKNWRCIKEIEFDLSKINIFLGRNATGKSSLAYALYFFSKAPRIGVEKALQMLYGLDARSVVRVENETLCYPVEILLKLKRNPKNLKEHSLYPQLVPGKKNFFYLQEE